jgi:hypothetical protein
LKALVVPIRRWEKYTGEAAVNAATGQTFHVCEEVRANV